VRNSLITVCEKKSALVRAFGAAYFFRKKKAPRRKENHVLLIKIYNVCDLGLNYTLFIALLTSGIDILNRTGT
jgi:hypothetical protein